MMTTADWLGGLGVTILLVAFLLNLAGRLDRRSPLYQGLNVLGAGLAGLAAVLLPFVPFVVLEGVWCLAAAVALVQSLAGRRGGRIAR